jgi:AAA+ ATPase superfamily predicted ATPase
MPDNPFTFGDLALDEAFTDREGELAELVSDMRNGQNVLVYAPRRYGKSSLVLRAAQEAQRRKVLVGYCDLMRTPTKERLAAALAKTIYADIASPIGNALERAANLFRSLRVIPTMEVDPADGSLRFTFQGGRRRSDIDETIERLLELPAELAVERKRRAVLIFDEFQEVLNLDKHFPNLMRAVFQGQPEVGHVYLGSRRHVLERIFSDRNEPFWRSAKRIELGMIGPDQFASFIRARFAEAGRRISDAAVERLLGATQGHPYATQELAYFVWEAAPGEEATVETVELALERVIRSEDSHLSEVWESAAPPQRLLMVGLAEEPTASPYAAAYRERHQLSDTPALQRALEALDRREIAGRRDDGVYVLVEPFLAEWLMREQRGGGIPRRAG